MPLTLAKLNSNRATAAITFGDDTLNVVYLPGKLTGKMMADMSALTALDPAALEEMPQAQAVQTVSKLTTSPGDMLKALLVEWDLAEELDEQGNVVVGVPCDAEHIDALGYVNQWMLLNGIMESVSNPKAKLLAPVASGSQSAPQSGAIS